MTNQNILERLSSYSKQSIESSAEFRGELTIVVKKEDIVRVCQFLRDDVELRFDMLKDICGADHVRPGNRFEVVYNLYSLTNNHRFRLKAGVDEADPHIPSVTSVWPAANWHEREAYDMYGIVFDGHPDLRRIYMPEEFEYYPLRKDFPLIGIPGSLPLPPK